MKNQDVKVFQDRQAIVNLLGHGWTKAYLMQVSQLTEQQALELLEMVQFLTMEQIFGLYAALSRGVFRQGPTTLLQKCWKCQSLAQTLLLVTLSWGQLEELLKMVKWIDEVMMGPKDTSKNARSLFLAHVFDLHLIMTVGDAQMQKSTLVDASERSIRIDSIWDSCIHDGYLVTSISSWFHGLCYLNTRLLYRHVVSRGSHGLDVVQ